MLVTCKVEAGLFVPIPTYPPSCCIKILLLLPFSVDSKTAFPWLSNPNWNIPELSIAPIVIWGIFELSSEKVESWLTTFANPGPDTSKIPKLFENLDMPLVVETVNFELLNIRHIIYYSVLIIFILLLIYKI